MEKEEGEPRRKRRSQEEKENKERTVGREERGAKVTGQEELKYVGKRRKFKKKKIKTERP